MTVAPYIGAAAVLLAALVVYIAPIIGEMRRLRAQADAARRDAVARRDRLRSALRGAGQGASRS